MKKTLRMIRTLFMAALLCSILTACAKSERAQAVDDLIASIGTVTDSSETLIMEAEQALEELSKTEQKQLDNMKILGEARSTYDQLQADKAIQAIDNIGVVSKTTKSKLAIKTAQKEYDLLSDNQKALVSNHEIIENALNEYNEMCISEVELLIGEIGDVNLESSRKINAAQIAYDALDEELQPQVDSKAILDRAAEELSSLQVSNVISMIDQIGTVTTDSGQKIAQAEIKHKELSDDQKTLITNHDILVNSRTEYNDLVTNAKIQAKADAVKSSVRISKLWISKPDSAGGVSLYINFTNVSDKPIKYLNFGATFYNAVGDVVTCTIKRRTVNYCSYTGPVAPGSGHSGTGIYWGKFYNYDIKSVKLSALEVEYMDGSKVEFSNDDLKLVQY